MKKIFDLAVQNHQKNNLQVAEHLYKEVLKTNPDHFESIFDLGTLLGQTKRFDLAKPLNFVIFGFVTSLLPVSSY